MRPVYRAVSWIIVLPLLWLLASVLLLAFYPSTAILLLVIFGLTVAIVTGVLLFVRDLFRLRRFVLREAGRVCFECGYPLAHTSGETACPECGSPFSPSTTKARWEGWLGRLQS